MIRIVIAVFTLVFCASGYAEEPIRDLVAKAISAAGGIEKLPEHFAWKEEFRFGESPKLHPRTAVLHPPAHWFQNGKDIAEGNADRSDKTYLASLWTLRPLMDPNAKLTALPLVEVDGIQAWGVKISNEKRQDVSLYFFQESSKLARIDWRTFNIFFADWKECEGFKYPAQAYVRSRDGKPHISTTFKDFRRVASDAKVWPEGK